MAQFTLKINGKDADTNNQVVRSFAVALLTQSPASLAWKNLTGNPLAVKVMQSANVDSVIEVTSISKGVTMTARPTVKAIQARLAVVASAPDWSWEILTDGKQTNQESPAFDLDSIDL